MNVLFVNSSLRKNSNSSLLSAQAAAGAAAAGHTVESIDIGKLRISPCLGCTLCLRPGSDYCVTRDDMHPLYPRIAKAEALILVSPIYWFNLCGQLKQFIDRCFAIAANPDPQGKSPFAGKKIGAVLTYGAEDPFDSGAVNALRCIQDICTYTGAIWAGAVYGCANAEGETAGNAALTAKAREFGAKL